MPYIKQFQGVQRRMKSESSLCRPIKRNPSLKESRLLPRLQGTERSGLMTDRIRQSHHKRNNSAPYPRDLQQSFAELRHNNFKTLKMINQLLAIYEYEIDTHSMETAAVEVSQLLSESVDLIESTVQSHHVTIKLHPRLDGSLVQLNKSSMLMVIINLLECAIENAGLNSTINLKAKTNQGSLKITIDNNQHVSANENQLDRLPSTSQLSLHFCKAIVEAHGGEFLFTVEENLESLFVVNIPSTADQ